MNKKNIYTFFPEKIFETIFELNPEEIIITGKIGKFTVKKSEIARIAFAFTSNLPAYPKEVIPIGLKQFLNYGKDVTSNGQQIMIAYKKDRKVKMRVVYYDKTSEKSKEFLEKFREYYGDLIEEKEMDYFEFRKKLGINNLMMYFYLAIIIPICFLVIFFLFIGLWWLESLLPF